MTLTKKPDVDVFLAYALTGPDEAFGMAAIAVIKELKASRKVVAAAKAYVDRIEREAAMLEPWNAPEMDGGILAALAELEAR